MPQSFDNALSYSERVDDISINGVSEAEGRKLIEEAKNNFADYFNKGWLNYRKSVPKRGIGATECSARRGVQGCLVGNLSDCLGGME